MTRFLIVAATALLLPLGSETTPAPVVSDGPAYTTDGAMKLPEDYREWVFLTAGLDINYNTDAAVGPGHSVFLNVFVNPSAYRSFQATGTWPDKTVLVLEIRGAEAKASIDKRGQAQSTDVRAIEVHVKDEARLPGKWGFFSFDEGKTAKLTERPASCYTCHEAHAAVDTTFVQFYPTLIGLAKTKGTLSPEYLKDITAPITPTAK
jgi:hypothetical protein